MLRKLSLITTISLCGFVQCLSAQVSLPAFLKAAEMQFLETEEKGVYKIPLEIDESVIMLYGYETVFWKDTDLQASVFKLYAKVLEIPRSVKPSAQMLMKIATLNEDVSFGGLSIAENAVWFNTAIWAKDANKSSFYRTCLLIFYYVQATRKELKPFIMESK